MLDELKKRVKSAEFNMHLNPADTFLRLHGPALIAAVELAESCGETLDEINHNPIPDQFWDYEAMKAYRAAKEPQ